MYWYTTLHEGLYVLVHYTKAYMYWYTTLQYTKAHQYMYWYTILYTKAHHRRHVGDSEDSLDFIEALVIEAAKVLIVTA